MLVQVEFDELPARLQRKVILQRVVAISDVVANSSLALARIEALLASMKGEYFMGPDERQQIADALARSKGVSDDVQQKLRALLGVAQ